jgi:hypothetical protein
MFSLLQVCVIPACRTGVELLENTCDAPSVLRKMMLIPTSHPPAAPATSSTLPDRQQEKGMKFDSFFSTSLRGMTGRSRELAKSRDQKR